MSKIQKSIEKLKSGYMNGAVKEHLPDIEAAAVLVPPLPKESQYYWPWDVSKLGLIDNRTAQIWADILSSVDG